MNHNQRDTDLMTIYANLKTTKSQSKYLQMQSAYKRIEDYVRSIDPDDYDEFHNKAGLKKEFWYISKLHKC